MSTQTPTTKELYNNIIAQLEASLSQPIPFIPKAFLCVIARVMAGVFITLYKYGGFIFLQKQQARPQGGAPTYLPPNGTILSSFPTPLTQIAGLTFDGTNLISCDQVNDIIYIHGKG